METTKLCSIIRSINKSIIAYNEEKNQSTRIFDDEEREKLFILIENNIDDCAILYQECNKLFDEIMTKYSYYGKTMCHDIYDKIYSYDDITDRNKEVYLEAIKKLNVNFSNQMDKLTENVQRFTKM